MLSTKTIVPLLLCGLAALLIAGCGGDEGDSDSDPQQLLDATFSGEGSVDSGVLDLVLEAESTGSDGGSLSGQLSGPFQSRGDDTFPLVDFDASLDVEGGSENLDFEGGLTITEDTAFVGVAGQEYEVDEATFAQLTDAFAQSAAARDEEAGEGGAIFEQFGIDPSEWLTDVTNEGVEEIGGAETVHISGTADLERIIADAERLDPTGDALGTDSEQLADSVRAADVDVFTGADDELLRRLALNLELEDPDSNGTLSLSLEFTVSDVNEDQEIEAPADAEPLDELVPGGLGGLGDVGGLGDIGGAGGGAGGEGGGAGGDGGGGAGAAGGAADLEDLGLSPEYQDCANSAKTPEEFADCADL